MSALLNSLVAYFQCFIGVDVDYLCNTDGRIRGFKISLEKMGVTMKVITRPRKPDEPIQGF